MLVLMHHDIVAGHLPTPVLKYHRALFNHILRARNKMTS